MHRIVPLFIIIAVVSACAAVEGRPTAGDNQDRHETSRGAVFARAHCASCHAIGSGTSPEPEAPSFEEIANAHGLTIDTLRPWLRNSHNFPEMMNFTIAPEQVDDLAAYIMTLQSADYRPPI